ncbi:MAG: hypothetical protein M3N37_02120, partial [Actinomycetota bacterium]|nr:hypothetical protein [Actinomycetota bacterium]
GHGGQEQHELSREAELCGRRAQVWFLTALRTDISLPIGTRPRILKAFFSSSSVQWAGKAGPHRGRPAPGAPRRGYPPHLTARRSPAGTLVIAVFTLCTLFICPAVIALALRRARVG